MEMASRRRWGEEPLLLGLAQGFKAGLLHQFLWKTLHYAVIFPREGKQAPVLLALFTPRLRKHCWGWEALGAPSSC